MENGMTEFADHGKALGEVDVSPSEMNALESPLMKRRSFVLRIGAQLSPRRQGTKLRVQTCGALRLIELDGR
jgi:hypothetical protein